MVRVTRAVVVMLLVSFIGSVVADVGTSASALFKTKHDTVKNTTATIKK